MKINHFIKLIVLALALMTLSVGFCACVDSAADEPADADVSSDTESDKNVGGEVFYAEVVSLTTDFGGILVNPEPPMMTGELIVHSDSMPSLSVGDRIKVCHDGQIALSYPGQVFGAVVSVVE